LKINVVKKCFPSYLQGDVEVVFNTLDLRSKQNPYRPFEVHLEGEKLVIPQRIYCDKNQLTKLTLLTSRQQAIAYCFFSRHYDGFIREYCIRNVLHIKEKFVVPFVVQLLGEYVIEIIDYIYQARDVLEKSHLREFIDENPMYYLRTQSRVYSYWDCYYRLEYPKYRKNSKPIGKTVSDYPGIKFLRYVSREVISERF
jgi:hypothetical protein